MKRAFSLLLIAFVLFAALLTRAEAAEADSALYDEEARRLLPIQSNDISGWPDGPAVSAQAAILMDADTGAVLYAKNIHERLYPASTTKILTCLAAIERLGLSDEVHFSQRAVMSLPAGSSNIGIDPGETLTFEQALYGILVGSANEVSNAVAEAAGGSIEEFVEIMNAKATELGCVDSHFNNTNGLPDSAHYTSAFDLATIARSFFDDPLLSRVSGTASYHFSPTAGQKDDFTIRNKHKLVNGEIFCEGVVGGKTGYTDLARETLVTCAERDGLKLICVVLTEESPKQFTDTVTLFDFGFNNFRQVSVASEESRFLPAEAPFGTYLTDIFGDASPALSFERSSHIVLPVTLKLEDTDTELVYGGGESVFARIDYSWHGVYLGSAPVLSDEGPSDEAETKAKGRSIVSVDLSKVATLIFGAAAVFCLAAFLVSLIRAFNFAPPAAIERRRSRRKRRHERLNLGE